MSYILDALKRADAERERGAVPGIHTKPMPSQGSTAAAGTPKRGWWLMAGAVAMGVVAAGLWTWRTPTPEASVATPLPVTTASLPTPEPALTLTPTLTLAPTPTPAPASVTVAPVPATLAAPAPKPLPMTTPATTPPAAVPTPAAPRPASPPTPTAATKAAAKPSAPAPVAASAPQDPPVTPAVVPLLSELPEAIRQQVPALKISGTVYSDTPSQRLLVVNNQVFTQGTQVAPEVNLEEIRPRSSVFNFRGTRFRVAH